MCLPPQLEEKNDKYWLSDGDTIPSHLARRVEREEKEKEEKVERGEERLGAILSPQL